VQRQLERLNSVEHQKLEKVRKWDKNIAEAVEWLRGNQDRFQMEVMEPPCMTVRVKDSRYADHLDTCFSTSQMKVRHETGCMALILTPIIDLCGSMPGGQQDPEPSDQ
jgi:hypothetical protein